MWGWGDDAPAAQRCAEDRLERVIARVARSESLDKGYGYPGVPLREEVIETLGDGQDESGVRAVVTRNGYGAQVLNASNMLFLDVDREPSGSGVFGRLFGKGKVGVTDSAGYRKLVDVLEREGGATFRIYETAAGLRVMAVDRLFDPLGETTGRLMRASGTDVNYARLCELQKSFRARLTPKPWRCGVGNPPGRHPRNDATDRRAFAGWLDAYQSAASSHATCRYLDSVGSGATLAALEPLIDLHDAMSGAYEQLPLA